MVNRSENGNIRQKAIPFLIFLTFLTPFVIQAFHHHSNNESIIRGSHQGTFLAKDDHCAICNFEFVSFLKSNVSKADKTPLFCGIFPVEKAVELTFFDFDFCSNRAPPLS